MIYPTRYERSQLMIVLYETMRVHFVERHRGACKLSLRHVVMSIPSAVDKQSSQNPTTARPVYRNFYLLLQKEK